MAKTKLLYPLLLSIILIQPVQAGDAGAGKEKSQTCIACHGAGGNSTNPIWPKLAGQHAAYIYQQLQDFHNGNRENLLMTAFISGLSDQDMQDIAAYYADQKTQLGFSNPQLAKIGEKIYRAGDKDKGLPACLACHGPNGAGNALAKFPSLSGQHAEYTMAQLIAFRDSKRTNDTNKVMRIISEKMTIQEIEAVANYIQGLH